MAQFKPADHSKGDANTIGGYQAVHDRPAAFDGPDGFSYSVALVAEPTGEPARPWAAWILFVRWARIGAQTPEGHLETDYLAYGETEHAALRVLGATPLSEVKRHLDALVLNSASIGAAPPGAASSNESPTSASPSGAARPGAAPAAHSNETPTGASRPGAAPPGAAPAAPSNETSTDASPNGAAPAAPSNESPTSGGGQGRRRWWDAMREPPAEDDA